MKQTILGAALLAVLAQVASAQPAPDAAAPAQPEPTPPEAPPPPPPPVVVVAPPPPEVKPADAPPPAKLSAGKQGVVQLGLLMQGWLVVDTTSTQPNPSSTFRLRRAEIAAKGEILPKRVAYKVMFDPAKVREFQPTKVTDGTGAMVNVQQPTTRVSVLQDFEITAMSKYADVSIGQFKIPVSWEGYNSSAKIILPERAIVSSTYGDVRDLGVKVTKTMPKWGYYVGLFNGLGANNLDNNNQKDIALRLEAYPVKGLTIAGVTYDSIGYRHRTGTKDRWEADVRYEANNLLVQAEYIRARDCTAATGCINGTEPVSAQGYYAAVGYTITDKQLGGSLQPVVRIGFLDPDTSKNLAPMMPSDKDELYHYDVGLNYYLQGHEMKLQASYQRQQFEDKAAINEFIAAAQVWY
jgi:phosphate-selective porin